jgi:NAD(P)-dependent dehydrogenase (short-subunit alcohol dehydrogenase family)
VRTRLRSLHSISLTACLAAEVADDGITVFGFAPAAHTDMARRLYEDEAIPAPLRARFHTVLLDSGDEMLRYSLEMFRFIATGGADHLSGQHVGFHATGRHRIAELRQQAPS